MILNFKTFKKTFFLFVTQSPFKNKKTRLRCIFAALLILVDVLAVTLVPYYTKLIVNSLAINLLNTIWVAMFLLSFFWILEKTVSHIQEIIFFPVINNTIRDLSYKVVHHIHNISLLDYQKLSIPEVINCARRISMSARSFIKICFLMIIPTTIKVMTASYIVIKTGLFGLMLLPAIFLAVFILYRGSQWYVSAREIAWQASDVVTTRISDSIMNTKIIRQSETFEMKTLATLLDTEANCWLTTNNRLHIVHILIGAVLGIAFTGILSFSILAIQAGTLTIGDFVLIKGQLIAAFLPLRTLSVEFRQCAESLVDIKKIIQILDMPLQSQFPSNTLLNSALLESPDLLRSPQNQTEQKLVLKNISFAHDAKKPIFDNLSLHIKKNEKIAIIGESGSGKSTLINLMAGLNKPLSGNITVDGRNIRELYHSIYNTNYNQKNQRQEKILYCIPQDFRLFNTSLRSNITYGLENISDFSILKVVKQLGLIELVNQMPEGLDTLVGEMGIKLSGGEKQKVALARALLLSPDILLLDETTSSLSVENEKEILDIIFSEISTVILTAHRTSMFQKVDRIIKIHQGQLFEFKEAHSNLESYLPIT